MRHNQYRYLKNKYDFKSDYHSKYVDVIKSKKWGDKISRAYLFLRKWNPRVPIKKRKFTNLLNKCKRWFESLNSKKLINFKFLKDDVDKIKKIYKTLSEGGLKYTGASKVMHVLNPNLFVMYDIGIREHYGCSCNEEGYINFMRSMKREVKEILNEKSLRDIKKEFKIPLLRLIDKYNWDHFKTSKINKR